MCGKTGTAQNPHGKNHSLFVAFAPRDNPKIAIAVVVENSGDGGTYAAPIASFIVEKYLRDSITRRPSGITPEYYTDLNLLPELKAPKLPARPVFKDTAKQPKAESIKRPAIKTASTKNKNITLKMLAAQTNRRKDE